MSERKFHHDWPLHGPWYERVPPAGGNDVGDLAKLAYEAYAIQQNWKDPQGNPIPPWDLITENRREGWRAAVNVVLNVRKTYE